MSIFRTKKQKTRTKGLGPKAKVADASGKLSTVLKGPWLSEKALIATEKGVYTFEVAPEVTKRDVTLAVEKFYKVTPKAVRMVNLPGKKVNLRTRRGFGMKSGRRKAYVTLKKGDTIQFA